MLKGSQVMHLKNQHVKYIPLTEYVKEEPVPERPIDGYECSRIMEECGASDYVIEAITNKVAKYGGISMKKTKLRFGLQTLLEVAASYKDIGVFIVKTDKDAQGLVSKGLCEWHHKNLRATQTGLDYLASTETSLLPMPTTEPEPESNSNVMAPAESIQPPQPS